MMRATVMTITVLLALCTCVGTIRGQEPRPDGVWVGVGGGGGLTTSDEFSGSERWGGSFYARVGGTLSQRALLGMEFIVWGKKYGDLSPARGNLSLVAFWYPTERGPLFLKGGAGVAIGAPLRTDPVGNITTHGATGVGLSGATGAHVRLGSSVFLTPGLDVLYQYFPAGQDPSLANFVLLVTVGITFH